MTDYSLSMQFYIIRYYYHVVYLYVHTFSITNTLTIIIIIIVDTITSTTIIIHSTTLTVTGWTLVVLQHSIDQSIIYMLCPVTLLYEISC